MPEEVKQRSVRGLVVHQDARYERANITLAYGFCSQALVGDNQKISIEKNVNLFYFTLEKVF